mmetsp:Transcript_14206/g.40388  ORF Transcript_14206/g.40388 Transcript_14206/m.40388 type:complete len:237 (+) Transcript_14206:3-713(+)
MRCLVLSAHPRWWPRVTPARARSRTERRSLIVAGVRPASDALEDLLAVRRAPRCLLRRGRRGVLRVPIEEVGHEVARLDLRRALATGPRAEEAFLHGRDGDGRAAQRWPLRVGLIQLVAPLPDALAGLQALGKVLLQAVLHAHERGLSVGVTMGLGLGLRARPIRRWSRNAAALDDRRDVGAEEMLVARSLEVPKDAPRGVAARGLGRRLLGAAEDVRHAEQCELHLGHMPSRTFA